MDIEGFDLPSISVVNIGIAVVTIMLLNERVLLIRTLTLCLNLTMKQVFKILNLNFRFENYYLSTHGIT